MSLRLLLPLALLVACSAPMECKERTAPIAAELPVCPARAKPPAPPPRTIEQVGAYAMRLERGRDGARTG